MVGVANTKWHTDRRWAPRFLAGFLIGGSVSALFVSAIVWLPVTYIVDLLGEPSRFILFILGPIALVAALLDIMDSTPTFRRQTPRTLSMSLASRPFLLGVVYGADIGAAVTTIQMSSLYWVVLLSAAVHGFVPVLTVALVAHAVLTTGITIQLASNRHLGNPRIFERFGTVRRSLGTTSASCIIVVLAAAPWQ